MTSTPEPLPSLPPSPIPDPQRLADDDIVRVWHDDVDESRLNPATATRRKNGKERARSRGDDGDDEDEDEDEDENGVVKGYPPTKEEEAESRRVEETLRRWEITERQRRKAARESASAISASSAHGVGNNAPSLFADLFRRDSRKTPQGRVGTHHALSSTDDGMPLEDLDTPSIDKLSTPPTPEPGSEYEHEYEQEREHDQALENPFDTPSASRTSLNIPANSAIMTESNTAPDEIAAGGGGLKAPASERPTLEASSSFAGTEKDSPNKEKGRRRKTRPPPPPKPLDLPAPRVPPPRPDGPHVERPPEPIGAPEVGAGERDDDGEEATPTRTEVERDRRGQREEGGQPPVRWWHEWLCGCGEGPDRGGDYQSGRTNPLE